MVGAAWWWRKSWLLLVGHRLGRLVVVAVGAEAVEAAGVLAPHHCGLVRGRRVERRHMAPLLLRHRAGDVRLAHRLDVFQPRLPGQGRRNRNVVQVNQSAARHESVATLSVRP